MNYNEMKNELNDKINEDAYVLAYFSDCVLLGKYVNKEISFNNKYDFNQLMELHVFNKTGEFVSIKDGNNEYCTRYLNDEIENQGINDLGYYVLGNKILQCDNGYTRLENKAGKDIEYPFVIKAIDDIKLVVRTYLNFNDDQQLYVVGHRLLGFKNEKGWL